MSEYWVSKDKYYCKYCKIYIADDKPSRNLHETGLKHKGNLERFIRDIYKKGESNKREAAEEAREIARMNAAAGVAMAVEGSADPSTAPVPAKKLPRASTSSDPFANYSTAESMGFVDEEGDREIAAQLERKAEGNMGQWESVAKKPKLVTVPIGDRELAAIKLEEDQKLREQEEIWALEEKEKEDRLLEKPNHHKFFQVKTVTLDEEEAYDPNKLGIKLKRQRLTLREEEIIKEEEDKKVRIKKEKLKLEQGAGGWNRVEIGAEPVLQFDSIVKEEIQEEVEPLNPDPIIVDQAKSVFKKRKGNAAQRMKY